jgi:F-type H+-transporting ATPase subunit epsilon
MIKLKIVTPDGIIYQDNKIEGVTLKTEDGVITIQSDHIPLLSIVKPGEVKIEKENHTVNLAISKGIVDVRRESEIYILADTAERAEEIDLKRAQEARERAEKILAQKESLEDIEFAKIQAKIEKELARISVGRKYRKFRSSNK